ncbi:hypothetical protein [Nonomuraea lactucae]|uniref:hypothetical protein n=1 Tax=Nonomuraea lactucae TaxID=2249762 RepID=UPI0019629B87|nr:hypothetical protein [Nonomuraea lactucae]
MATLRERAGRVGASLEETRREHRKVPEAGEAPRLFVIEVEYAVRMREAELGWIEEIVGAELGAAVSWGQEVIGLAQDGDGSR